MSGWFTITPCIICVSFFLVTIVLAELGIVIGRSHQGFLKNRSSSFFLPKILEFFKSSLIISSNLSQYYLDAAAIFYKQQLSLKIFSLLLAAVLKNLKLPNNMPLDTNLRINYYDVEMVGMNPAFCGDYSALRMPAYSIKESKSSGIQLLYKLYFQNYRDVHTHSMCNHECIFDCRQVGYDEHIMTELLVRNTFDLHVYQCDRNGKGCKCLTLIRLGLHIFFISLLIKISDRIQI
ncbi:Phosphoglucosamine mutase [Dirofilaria immitis]